MTSVAASPARPGSVPLRPDRSGRLWAGAAPVESPCTATVEAWMPAVPALDMTIGMNEQGAGGTPPPLTRRETGWCRGSSNRNEKVVP